MFWRRRLENKFNNNNINSNNNKYTNEHVNIGSRLETEQHDR